MHTTQYFIDKFSKIPERKWTTGVLTKKVNIFMGITSTKHCALGHVEYGQGWANPSDQSYELTDLFHRYLNKMVSIVNDNRSEAFPQRTPKERILAALYHIKDMQEKEAKDAETQATISELQSQIDMFTDSAVEEAKSIMYQSIEDGVI